MKQNDEKKNCRGDCWATAQFFSKCESQYSKLYCDTELDKQGLGDRPGRAAGARMVVHDTAGWATIEPTTWPREATTRPAAWLGVSVSQYNRCIMTGARAWLAGDGSRYNQLYRDKRAVWSLRRVTIQSLVS